MLNAKKLKKDLLKLEKKQKELAVLEAKINKLKKEIEELEKPFKILQQPQPQVTTQLGDTGANITITTKKPLQGTQTL